MIPLFEFIEGRIVLKTFNERHINTLALQQGAVSNFHLWRFIFSNCIFDSLDNNYVPNKFLVNGLLEKKLFKKIKYNNIEHIGSLRSKVYKAKIKSNRRCILILLDMHNWTKILDFTMKEVAKNYFGKLIIRAHPSNPDISNYIKNLIYK